MSIMQHIRVGGHANFTEYAMAQSNSDNSSFSLAEFPEYDAYDHSNSQVFRSHGLADSDTDSTEELSDAPTQAGEPRSPDAQQGRNTTVLIITSNARLAEGLTSAFQYAVQCTVCIGCNTTPGLLHHQTVLLTLLI